MSSADCMAIANNGTFQQRVKYYMQRAAIAVMAEAPEHANHADRVAYARRVLDVTGSTGMAASIAEYAIAVVTNSTIAATIAANPLNQAAISDNDLEFTVNSMFDAFAG